MNDDDLLISSDGESYFYSGNVVARAVMGGIFSRTARRPFAFVRLGWRHEQQLVCPRLHWYVTIGCRRVIPVASCYALSLSLSQLPTFRKVRIGLYRYLECWSRFRK